MLNRLSAHTPQSCTRSSYLDVEVVVGMTAGIFAFQEGQQIGPDRDVAGLLRAEHIQNHDGVL